MNDTWKPPLGGLALATVRGRKNMLVVRHTRGSVFSVSSVEGMWEHPLEELENVRPTPFYSDFTVKSHVVEPLIRRMKEQGGGFLNFSYLLDDFEAQEETKVEEPLLFGAIVKTSDGTHYVRLTPVEQTYAWGMRGDVDSLHDWDEDICQNGTVEVVFPGIE